jgi:nitrous oxidase accessory protein NosD
MPTSMSLSPSGTARSWRLLRGAVPRLVAVVVLVAAATVAGATASAASTLACGAVITADTTLTHDLLNCPDTGLVIGADGITLDLGGHTVDGDGTPVASCPDGRRCDVGVDNSAGHRDVTVEHGTIQQFTDGVFLQDAAGDRVHGLTIRHTGGAGVFAPGATGAVIDGNTITDPGVVAMSVFGGSDLLVARNVASGSSGYLVFLLADRSRIEENRLASGEHGFAVGGTGTVVRHNTVRDSGGSIDVWDGSTGVRVEDNELRRVGDGVVVGVSSETLVRNNVVDATGGGERGGFGVILDGAVRTTVEDNQVRSSWTGPAIYVAHLEAPTASQDSRILANHATSTNADGILVDPDATGTLLAGNVAVGSGHDGIDVTAPGTTVTRNVANANRALGIFAVPGVVDGGGNRAAGNGDPAQCVGISCR